MIDKTKSHQISPWLVEVYGKRIFENSSPLIESPSATTDSRARANDDNDSDDGLYYHNNVNHDHQSREEREKT